MPITHLGNNPFFWIVLYLAGYITTIGVLAFFGMGKIRNRIPQSVIRAFIVLIFVLPPIVLPFTQGPRIKIPTVSSFFAGLILLSTGITIRMIAQKKIILPLGLKNKETLVTTGIYGFVRHPLYISNGLFAIGLALLFKSLYAFLFSILYAFLYLPITYFEERDLLKKYGEEYKKYKEEVGLLFPKKRQKHKDSDNKNIFSHENPDLN